MSQDNLDRQDTLARNNMKAVFGSGMGRIGLITLGVAMALMFAYGSYKLFFSGPRLPAGNKKGGSPVTAAPSDSSAQGFKPVSVSEGEKRAQLHYQDAQQAKEQGTAYIAKPVVTDSVVDNRGAPPPVAPVAQKPQDPPAKPVPPPVPPPPQPIDADLRKAIMEQVQSVMQASGPKKNAFTTVYTLPPPEAEKTAATEKTEAEKKAEVNAKGDAFMVAGDTCYATLDNGISTDDTIVVLATIHSCPGDNAKAMKGARLIGRIEKAQDQMRATFDRMTLVGRRDGAIPVNAIAVTEDEARSGIGQDVDKHYFSRYFSLGLASLLSGYGKAAMADAQTGRTVSTLDTVITDRDSLSKDDKVAIALGEMGTAFSSEIKKDFNRPTTVSSPRGMGIGVIFVNDVYLPKQATRKQ